MTKPNPPWYEFASTCPVCEGEMQTNYDIDRALYEVVCWDNYCGSFYEVLFNPNNGFMLVYELNNASQSEYANLDMLKTCPKCKGDLGSAGETVVCDGLKCGTFYYRDVKDGRYLLFVGKTR